MSWLSKRTKSLKGSVKKFVKDPGRLGAFVATGGLSEFARAGMKEAMKVDKPGTPEMPTRDVAAEQAAVEAADLEQRRSAGRGRASTILGGGSSNRTLDGVASLARRTLQGY